MPCIYKMRIFSSCLERERVGGWGGGTSVWAENSVTAEPERRTGSVENL